MLLSLKRQRHYIHLYNKSFFLLVFVIHVYIFQAKLSHSFLLPTYKDMKKQICMSMLCTLNKLIAYIFQAYLLNPFSYTHLY
jgi:hypothetical protein